jgi:hypothetical protein
MQRDERVTGGDVKFGSERVFSLLSISACTIGYHVPSVGLQNRLSVKGPLEAKVIAMEWVCVYGMWDSCVFYSTLDRVYFLSERKLRCCCNKLS